jgi:RimJ/RimL family protein N-acetyltransferase
VTLRDGARIAVRPIGPNDADALVRGFEALSPESRYRRFLSPMNRLSAGLVKYLTDVDHHDHEALVAEVSGHELVGVARYVRLEEEPDTAEVAVAVVDDWQGRGVASEILSRLAARAQEEGITRFRATCLADNRTVLDVLRGLGVTGWRSVGAGVMAVDVELAGALEAEHPLRAIVRRAAEGVLSFRHPAMGRER